MRILITLVYLLPQILVAQLSGTFNASLGDQGEVNSSLVASFSGDIGHTFLKDLYTFGGMKLDRNYIIYPSETRTNKEYYDNITTDIWNFNLYTGIRYSITIKEYGKLATIERIGIFPEVRGYFTPHLPSKYYYYNDKEVITKTIGDNTTQFSYGIGGGFFFGSIDGGYMAIKYEYSTIDPFEVVRTLEPHELSFSTGADQHLITLSFYIR